MLEPVETTVQRYFVDRGADLFQLLQHASSHIVGDSHSCPVLIVMYRNVGLLDCQPPFLQGGRQLPTSGYFWMMLLASVSRLGVGHDTANDLDLLPAES